MKAFSRFSWVLIVITLIIVINLVIYRTNYSKNEQHSLEDKILSISESIKEFLSKDENMCDNELWCNITMPTRSYYRFDPPTDVRKWRLAQIAASRGEHVLLSRVVQQFPNYLDFLDGDVWFRRYHYPVDIFYDKYRNLSSLTDYANHVHQSFPNGEYKWEKNSPVITPPYNYKRARRAPVVKLGYYAFSRESSPTGGTRSDMFEGHIVGEASMNRQEFLKSWNDVKKDINTPFIALHSSNENWGLLSTNFPNRTLDWGRCCDEPNDKILFEMLNHEKTLAFFVNQHHNISHPKLLSLPRGMPIYNEHAKRILWDTMRILLLDQQYHTGTSNDNSIGNNDNTRINTLKNKLVFTSSSSWGWRPQILNCIRSKFPDQNEFFGSNYDESKKNRFSMNDYYIHLARARMSVALPGLGYDTFRLWEAMTLGTVPIIERATGLDKTLWRLPALIVDDYDTVTPELLRTAYVEAIYRAEEFEYERLKMSWWWTLLANISVAMSSQPLYDKFPPYADEIYFKRPAIPFDCAKTDTCGAQTVRTPKSSC